MIGLRTLGNNDHCALETGSVTALDHLGNFFEMKGDFRDQDDVGSTCNASPKCNPSRMPSHDLNDNHPLVTSRRGMETIQRIRHARDGGIEAECHRRRLQIVVDGLGHTNHRETRAVELKRRAHGAITADCNDCGEIEVSACFGGLGDHLVGDPGLVTTSYL